MLDKVNSRSHTPAASILELSLPLGNGLTVCLSIYFSIDLYQLSDGLEAALVYLYPRNPSWAELLLKLFTRIIVALDNPNRTRSQFIRKLFAQQSAQHQVATFVNEIKIHTAAETNTDYLLEIRELCMGHGISPEAVGISARPKSENREGSSHEQLSFKGDRYLDKEAVFKMVHSLEDLLTLKMKNEETKHSSFNWTDALIKVIPGAEEAQLNEFLSHFDIDIDTGQIFRIIEALRSNGQQSIAYTLLDDVR